jgi:hypothetical protein
MVHQFVIYQHTDEIWHVPDLPSDISAWLDEHSGTAAKLEGKVTSLIYSGRDTNNRLNWSPIDYRYEHAITIDDPYLAVEFKLRWSHCIAEERTFHK